MLQKDNFLDSSAQQVNHVKKKKAVCTQFGVKESISLLKSIFWANAALFKLLIVAARIKKLQ